MTTKIECGTVIYDAIGPALVLGVVDLWAVVRRPHGAPILLAACEIDSLHYTQWKTEPEKKA